MDAVLITTSSFGKDNPELLGEIKRFGFEAVMNPFGRTLQENEIKEMIEKHDPVGIIAGVEPITQSVLKGSRRLKVISRCGIGIENVDQNACKLLGIKILNTPDAPAQAVAELTLGLILGLIRRISEADRNIRNGKWDKLTGRLLGSLTVGIIGCGRIGSRVAVYLKAFSSKVIGFDEAMSSHADIKMVSLPELLRESDLVTFHIPVTPETTGMLNDHFIKQMKQGSFLINAARGEIFDEKALIRGLESGKIAGAALDTFNQEPYKGPLVRFENVLLTAHMGSYAREARSKMEAEAVKNLITGLGVKL
jgi:D-3-phosphoglycerate dehydrogenase / 2-oxoglutarate reductase